MFFFFKQKTAYEMRISDWSSDVCSSDLVGPVVPDRARGKLHAVAHDVVLIGEDVERVFRFQRLQLALRHREGVVAESTFFASSSYSYIGKSTIQQKRKAFSSIRPSSSPTRVRASPASFAASFSLPAAKNTPSSRPRPSAAISFAVPSSP